VQAFLDPSWSVTFEHADGRWWFTTPSTNGNFTGSLIEVAVHVSEQYSDSDRWPTCATHRQRIQLRSDGQSVQWVCAGPPAHAAPAGELGSLVTT